MSRQSIAILFARRDSIYKELPDCDVWDADRDALRWPGGMPIVAHPPCRAWGRLSHMAKPRPGERDLALWAVDQIRQYGGVLEHPAGSSLWKEKPLPEPGQVDAWGGWTLVVSQWWWGHKAENNTRLYICGVSADQLPPIPFKIGESTHVIAQSNLRQKLRLRPEVTKAEREHTPPEFAKWLCEVARLCRFNQQEAA